MRERQGGRAGTYGDLAQELRAIGRGLEVNEEDAIAREEPGHIHG